MASAFFTLDGLRLLGPHLAGVQGLRILFGDDASARDRERLLDDLRARSDEELRAARAEDPLLSLLDPVRRLFEQNRVEARVYTAKKFHAKLYVSHAEQHPTTSAILGSGNFTRPGLTQNIELNLEPDNAKAQELAQWFEERWSEAQADTVTEDLLKEIVRQLFLYSPRVLADRALLEIGDDLVGEGAEDTALLRRLDPHQRIGFEQVRRTLARSGGAMVCDGVGLGKSFIGLAVMESYLRAQKNVLLIAPSAILESGWKGYLRTFMSNYMLGYGRIKTYPMTDFGFDFTEPEQDENGDYVGLEDKDKRNSLKLKLLAQDANLVVIDESHNFRKTNSKRYVNVLKLLQDPEFAKKRVLLLTATPLNTEYRDVTAQFALLAGDEGRLAGRAMSELKRTAGALDAESRKKPDEPRSLLDPLADAAPLMDAMEDVAIQRSRAACVRFAENEGKTLRFPSRLGPYQIHYTLSNPYETLVHDTERDFKELAEFIKTYQEAVRLATKAGRKTVDPPKLPKTGLRFSAYLPGIYRKEEVTGLREANMEAFLVGLVFTNVMKQLESSIVAFEGIIRALGAGLCARLKFVFDDEEDEAIAEHLEWVLDDTGIPGAGGLDDPTESDIPISGEEDEDDAPQRPRRGRGRGLRLSEEQETYLEGVIASREIARTLEGFGPETHRTKKWRADVLSDLVGLRKIHARLANVRMAPDPKFEAIGERIRAERAEGRKVLVFTQSKRTAAYLREELEKALHEPVGLIDQSVAGNARARLLHAFAPAYNPLPRTNPYPGELDLLVCTDVLSEGVNLQSAGCILSYDLHWNPTRLIQRIGRVDRRLREDDPDHDFKILNVLPPPAIEEILELVGKVEGRKRKIADFLGLDLAFFSSQDPEGTLREFNGMLDGEITPTDRGLARYRALLNDPKALARARLVPEGAFGVWAGAPFAGALALFRVVPARGLSPEEERAHAVLLGRPVLAARKGGEPLTDRNVLLNLLLDVPEGDSGTPSPDEELRATLKALRRDAQKGLSPKGWDQSLKLQPLLWMELRP